MTAAAPAGAHGTRVRGQRRTAARPPPSSLLPPPGRLRLDPEPAKRSAWPPAGPTETQTNTFAAHRILKSAHHEASHPEARTIASLFLSSRVGRARRRDRGVVPRPTRSASAWAIAFVRAPRWRRADRRLPRHGCDHKGAVEESLWPVQTGHAARTATAGVDRVAATLRSGYAFLSGDRLPNVPHAPFETLCSDRERLTDGNADATHTEGHELSLLDDQSGSQPGPARFQRCCLVDSSLASSPRTSGGWSTRPGPTPRAWLQLRDLRAGRGWRRRPLETAVDEREGGGAHAVI